MANNEEQYPIHMKIFVMRHGEKDPKGGTYAELTDEGYTQAMLAGRSYLYNTNIGLVFSSGINRAAESAQIALSSATAGSQRQSAVRVTEFGFEGLHLDEYGPAMKLAAEKKAAGGNVTMADFQEWMPVYFPQAQQRLLEGFEFAAECLQDANERVALVGSHSPFSEVLAKDLTTIPALGEAGIILYHVYLFGDGHVEVVGSELIFKGF